MQMQAHPIRLHADQAFFFVPCGDRLVVQEVVVSSPKRRRRPPQIVGEVPGNSRWSGVILPQPPIYQGVESAKNKIGQATRFMAQPR